MLNHTKSHTSAVYTRERVFTDSIVCVCVCESRLTVRMCLLFSICDTSSEKWRMTNQKKSNQQNNHQGKMRETD